MLSLLVVAGFALLAWGIGRAVTAVPGLRGRRRESAGVAHDALVGVAVLVSGLAVGTWTSPVGLAVAGALWIPGVGIAVRRWRAHTGRRATLRRLGIGWRVVIVTLAVIVGLRGWIGLQAPAIAADVQGDIAVAARLAAGHDAEDPFSTAATEPRFAWRAIGAELFRVLPPQDVPSAWRSLDWLVGCGLLIMLLLQMGRRHGGVRAGLIAALVTATLVADWCLMPDSLAPVWLPTALAVAALQDAVRPAVRGLWMGALVALAPVVGGWVVAAWLLTHAIRWRASLVSLAVAVAVVGPWLVVWAHSMVTPSAPSMPGDAALWSWWSALPVTPFGTLAAATVAMFALATFRDRPRIVAWIGAALGTLVLLAWWPDGVWAGLEHRTWMLTSGDLAAFAPIAMAFASLIIAQAIAGRLHRQWPGRALVVSVAIAGLALIASAAISIATDPSPTRRTVDLPPGPVLHVAPAPHLLAGDHDLRVCDQPANLRALREAPDARRLAYALRELGIRSIYFDPSAFGGYETRDLARRARADDPAERLGVRFTLLWMRRLDEIRTLPSVRTRETPTGQFVIDLAPEQ